MDNVFTDFIATYWDDIAAFLNAFRDFITALIGKVSGNGEADAE